MKKKIMSLMLVFIMLFALVVCAYNSGNTGINISDTKIPLTDGNNSVEDALLFVRQMGAGWNLGNSFCCVDDNEYGVYSSSYYETLWGNPVTTKSMIDAVKNKGFKTIRIPVSYRNHLDENNCIDESWLARLKEVVDYVIQNDMFCIINLHHENWLIADVDKQEVAEEKLSKVWNQVSLYFKDYSNKLVFEGFNEVINSDGQWDSAKEESYGVVNRYNQVFVETVRSTGGNNSSRFLIVNTYAAKATKSVIDGFVLPNDSIENHLIVGTHIYDGISNATIKFSNLNDAFVKKGIPVIVGEWGTINSSTNTENVRIDYANSFLKIASDYGIPCLWWDDGGIFSSSSAVTNFAILQRNSGEWYFDELATVLIENAKNLYVSNDNDTDIDTDVFGMKDFSNWKSGTYDRSTGRYCSSTARICLNNYVNVSSDKQYKANISIERFSIMISEIDANNSFIKTSEIKNGEVFIPDNKTIKIGITLRDGTGITKNYDAYRALFEGSFEAYLSIVKEELSDEINKSEENDIAEDNIISSDDNIASKDINDNDDINVVTDNFGMTDFANWKSGTYDKTTGRYCSSSGRICLSSYVNVKANEQYKTNISINRFSLLVSEMDANNNFIKTTEIKNGEILLTEAKTEKLGITLRDGTGMTKSYDAYKSLFEGDFKAYLSIEQNSASNEGENIGENEIPADINNDSEKEEIKDNTEIVFKKDIFGMKDFANWKSGTYDRTTGRYCGSSGRICLNNYINLSSNEKYSVNINVDRFSVLISEMDANNKFIKTTEVKNGVVFIADEKTQKVGITLRDSTGMTKSYEAYKSLFENNFYAFFELIEMPLDNNGDSVDISNDVSDSVLDNVESSEGIFEITGNDGKENDSAGGNDAKVDMKFPADRIDSGFVLDVFDMLEKDNWIEGTFSPNGGNYSNDASKMCLKYYVDVNVGETYSLYSSDTSFRLLVKAIDENGLIRGVYNMSNGDTLPIELGITKLAISAYDSSNTKTNYEAYRNALNNGLKLYMTLTPSKYTEGEKNLISELLNLVNVGSTDSKNVLSYKVSFSSFYNTILPDLKNNMAYLNYQSCDKFQTTSSISGNYISTVAWKNYNSDYINRLDKMKHSINEFLATVDDNMSDTEKVLLAHEYIVNKAYYKDSGDVRSCASGILADGYGVCESYSESLGVLLHYMGIEYDLVISNSMNHEWLMVCLDGQWYHIDPTWDDTRAGTNAIYQHRFLLKNDNEFTQMSTNKHYNWNVYERYGTTSTSNKYSNWFVHDVAGNMYYHNSMWYYVDNNSNSIYKSNISGEGTTLVYKGNSAIVLKEIVSGVLTYTEGGCTKQIQL